MQHLRSGFGDQMLPFDIANLKKKGVPIGPFTLPQSLQNERQLYVAGTEALAQSVLELFPQMSTSIEHIAVASQQTLDTMLDIIFRAKQELICFEPQPTKQMETLIRLLFGSAASGEPFPIVSPVCPDYGRGYALHDGLSETAKRSIDAFARYRSLFAVHGITPHLTIHLADVEADDSVILSASQETRESFLQKIAKTHEEIVHYADKKGVLSQTSVNRMSTFLRGVGIQYGQEVDELAQRILQAQDKRIRSVHANLVKERREDGDYNGLTSVSPEQIAANELAGYRVYGSAVNARAFLVSPDAKSAIPAYNFFQDQQHINATAYIKRGGIRL